MTTLCIHAHNLVCDIQGKRLLAIDSLTIQQGEHIAIVGHNGAGKSTLMKLIFGLLQPDEGRIFLDGTEVRWQSPEHARGAGIAMVFQHFALFESLSVAENVWLGMDKSW